MTITFKDQLSTNLGKQLPAQINNLAKNLKRPHKYNNYFYLTLRSYILKRGVL